MTNHRPFVPIEKRGRFCATCHFEFDIMEPAYRTPDGKFYCLPCIPFLAEIEAGRLKPSRVKVLKTKK